MLERLASIRSGIGENMEDRYLFKAKRIDNGEWVQGALLDGESHCLIGQEIRGRDKVDDDIQEQRCSEVNSRCKRKE